MSIDLVERLRMQGMDTDMADTAREAADEIERLTVNLGGSVAALKMCNDEIERMQAEIERLRAALEQIERLDSQKIPATRLAVAISIARDALNIHTTGKRDD